AEGHPAEDSARGRGEEAVVARRGRPVLALEERVLGMARVRGRDLAEVRVLRERPAGDGADREAEQQDDRAEPAQEAGHQARAAAATAGSARRNTPTRARRRGS